MRVRSTIPIIYVVCVQREMPTTDIWPTEPYLIGIVSGYSLGLMVYGAVIVTWANRGPSLHTWNNNYLQ